MNINTKHHRKHLYVQSHSKQAQITFHPNLSTDFFVLLCCRFVSKVIKGIENYSTTTTAEARETKMARYRANTNQLE